MKKLITLICSTFICFTQADVTYIVSNTNAKGCNYLMRQESSNIMVLEQPFYNIAAEHNGDDTDVANYAGSFSKTLEHDASTGILTTAGQIAYEQLLTYMQTGLISDSNAITRAPGATLELVSPQAAFARSLAGIPAAIIPMPSAPKLASSHAAAEMIEVYLKALCRDVRFEDYGTGANTDVDTINGGSITNNASAILTALGDAYKGPRNDEDKITAAELFRGPEASCLVGPYISQYLYQPLWYLFESGSSYNQYISISQGTEFGANWDDFVAIQNGTVPVDYANDEFNGLRHIIDGRDAGTAVHSDGPGEFFLHAANILVQAGAPTSSTFPYGVTITNECAFVNMAPPDLYTAILSVFKEGLKHAWNHKWRANRRLRPEAMAGLVHQAVVTDTNPYNLPAELFSTLGGINVLDWINTHNQNHNDENTYLLPLMYPEGSPTHPSYPAGHAVMSGACSTIIKAFFDDQATLVSFGLTPVKPDPNDPQALIAIDGEDEDILTIGSELDKLASNIALARNFAGVHYRADGDEGILLGEQVALTYLQDYARMYSETGFVGFELTKRNGERVRITPYGIMIIALPA